MCDNNCKCKSEPQLLDVLARLLGRYIDATMKAAQKKLKVFLTNGDIADVIVISNKEVDEEYITSIVPNFKSIVPTPAEIMLKAEVRYSKEQARVIKDIYYELAYMLEEKDTEDWAMLVKLFAMAYSDIPFTKLKEDFDNLPEDLYKDIKKMRKEIRDCFKENNFWESVYKVEDKAQLPSLECRLSKHGAALGAGIVPNYVGTQNRYKKTKNYYNVRDSKGRFTKKAKKRYIKR